MVHRSIFIAQRQERFPASTGIHPSLLCAVHLTIRNSSAIKLMRVYGQVPSQYRQGSTKPAQQPAIQHQEIHNAARGSVGRGRSLDIHHTSAEGRQRSSGGALWKPLPACMFLEDFLPSQNASVSVRISDRKKQPSEQLVRRDAIQRSRQAPDGKAHDHTKCQLILPHMMDKFGTQLHSPQSRGQACQDNPSPLKRLANSNSHFLAQPFPCFSLSRSRHPCWLLSSLRTF
jgi:hypothetical protein